jgi:co-chaperonin GroES (HSP10)
MVTATKERRSTALRPKRSGGRIIADRKGSRKGAQRAIVSPEEAKTGSTREEVIRCGREELNKNGEQVRLPVKPGRRVLPLPQRLPDEEVAATSVHSVSRPEQDPVSVMKQTYRAIWSGILSEERIEDECRCIERLFCA